MNKQVLGRKPSIQGNSCANRVNSVIPFQKEGRLMSKADVTISTSRMLVHGPIERSSHGIYFGLEQHISVDVVDWRMNRDGSWSFNPEEEGATADTVTENRALEGIYNRAFEGWNESRSIGTVPVLWDKKHATIVNNESREIIRMFDQFSKEGFGNGTTLCPPELMQEIDNMIDANYESVNNGVYKSGFARTQEAYDEAVTALFERLDQLEAHLEGRVACWRRHGSIDRS